MATHEIPPALLSLIEALADEIAGDYLRQQAAPENAPPTDRPDHPPLHSIDRAA